jgi:hypothetical protein
MGHGALEKAFLGRGIRNGRCSCRKKGKGGIDMKCNFKTSVVYISNPFGEPTPKKVDPPVCPLKGNIRCDGEENCVLCVARDIQVKGIVEEQ